MAQAQETWPSAFTASAPWSLSPSIELRITCVAHGLKPRASFRFTGWCWWRSLLMAAREHLGTRLARPPWVGQVFDSAALSCDRPLFRCSGKPALEVPDALGVAPA